MGITSFSTIRKYFNIIEVISKKKYHSGYQVTKTETKWTEYLLEKIENLNLTSLDGGGLF